MGEALCRFDHGKREISQKEQKLGFLVLIMSLASHRQPHICAKRPELK